MENNGKRTAIELNKEEFKLFFELIKNINLKDIFLSKEKIEIHEKRNNGSSTIKIELKIKTGNINLEKRKAYIEYTIKLREKNKIIYKQETEYIITLNIKNIDKVSEIIKNKKIYTFFIEKQLNKIVWPFLRVDFHNNLGRVGIRPVTLPLLK
ncbi:hypothetical protein SAMN02745164_02101 [Marinitoga hydrogenitolerans DSM 16785]|uniref:Uncharacterized protein n=1 Tax=Marinitoga hydrogenitolerans (strain DSM 16785 / JCM 12826 / AT1271) TaxID=1122195 RepID=A0A1M5A5C3_MARH1|nr:hypothetical protein [Marinitoga hydrogenitolerans]SHF25488.1 hypothetical protein SAMN02745164_02101 [Marinitoga hydrogenitolerans DSM 16785]